MSLTLHSFKYKISFFIVSCLAFSLAINALLNYFNFEESYKSARRSNFVIIAEDIVGTIEYGLDMGLAPEEMKNIGEILKLEIAENKNIQLLAVVNKKGEALYKSGIVDNTNTPNGTFCIKDTKEQIKNRTICISIKNSFKVEVAFLILKYTQENGYNPVQAMALYLIKLFIITISISSVIITLSVSFIFSKLVKDFIKMNNSISHINDDNSNDNPSENEVSPVLNNFKKTSKELLNDLIEIEKDIVRDDVH